MRWKHKGISCDLLERIRYDETDEIEAVTINEENEVREISQMDNLYDTLARSLGEYIYPSLIVGFNH